MPCAVSVIVRIERGGGWLTRLIGSLDAQTLPYDAFEVLVEPAEPESAIAQRMTELATRRPNLRVAAHGDSADLACGEWVLDLGTDLHTHNPVLLPHALERLVDFGTEHGLDVVLARATERSGNLVPDLLTGDRPLLADADRSGSGGVAARRRASNGTGPAGVLGRCPVLVVEALESPVEPASVQVTGSSAGWDDGRLVVSAEGLATALPAAAQVLFSVLDRASGSEHWLTARSQNIEADRFTASADLDVRTAAAGAALTEGNWQVRVGVHGQGTGWSRRAALPSTAAAPGIVDGILVVPTAVEATLTVDVGARKTSAIGRLDVADISINDSAKGTELTAFLPRLAAVGDSDTPGYLLLDSFRIPARLVATAGSARVLAYVSGLAGTSALGTQFGGGASTPTGLSLEIAPIGTMRVRPAAASAPVVTTTPAAGPAKAAASATATRAPLVVRLRRRVPGRLEPAAAALSHNKLARRMYQRLTWRSASPG